MSMRKARLRSAIGETLCKYAEITSFLPPARCSASGSPVSALPFGQTWTAEAWRRSPLHQGAWTRRGCSRFVPTENEDALRASLLVGEVYPAYLTNEREYSS